MESDTWRDKAKCKVDKIHHNVFFPEERNRPVTKLFKAEVEEIRNNICGLCPVQAECLKDAMRDEYSLNNGIWAGTTPEQRRALKETQDND